MVGLMYHLHLCYMYFFLLNILFLIHKKVCVCVCVGVVSVFLNHFSIYFLRHGLSWIMKFIDLAKLGVQKA